MSKKANQKLKLFYLAKILNEMTDDDHGMSIKEIISELDKYGISAERKSLYDDFNMLNDFGLDVEKDGEGSKTKYFIAEREFELPELKLLVDSVQTSRFISKKKSETLIKKLESLTSTYQASELNRQVHVQNRIKSQNELALHIIDNIHNAINNNEKISFMYYDWNENKEKEYRHNGKTYVVSPWALLVNEDKYYLLSFDDDAKDMRTYKINKMEKVNILDKKRDGEEIFKKFDMDRYGIRSFSMYGGELTHVTVRVDKDVLNVITDRFGKDDLVMYKAEGEGSKIDCVLNVYESRTFYSWLTIFGNKIEIISPNNVKENYIKYMKEAIKNYE